MKSTPLLQFRMHVKKIKTVHGLDLQNAIVGSYSSHEKLIQYHRTANLSRDITNVYPSTYHINRTVLDGQGCPVGQNILFFRSTDDKENIHWYTDDDLKKLAGLERFFMDGHYSYTKKTLFASLNIIWGSFFVWR